MGALGDAYSQFYQSSQPPHYILQQLEDTWHIYALDSNNLPRHVLGTPAYPSRAAAEEGVQILLTAWKNAREKAVTNSLRKLGIAPSSLRSDAPQSEE